MRTARSDRLVGAAALGTALCALLLALAHPLLVAALVHFGWRAGGFPLHPLAVAEYGLLTVAACALALRASARTPSLADRLLPLVVLAPFLAVTLAGAFFATEVLPIEPLPGLRLPTEYAPYLDDDGAFAWTNAALAVWIVALALAAQWRGLLVGGLLAQGLALLLNPAVWVVGWYTLERGANPEHGPLLAVPLLYLGGAVALGWRPRGWRPTAGPPGRLALVGAGLAVVAGVAALAWSYLALGDGGGDGYLPAEGRLLGWIGKTVPEDAYGLAGDALLLLRRAYPWLVGAAGLAWLGAVLGRGWQVGLGAALRRLGLPGGFTALGLAALLQTLPTLFLLPTPLPVQGYVGALPVALGEPGLQFPVFGGAVLLALGLLGSAALLSQPGQRWPGWLTFGATLLALLAAVELSAGLVAGTFFQLDLQQRLTLPEFQQEAQLRLALSLPFNAACALLGWAVVGAGARALLQEGGSNGLPRPALRGGVALASVGLSAVGLLLWQGTAMPVAETSPRAGAADVPTNAPIVVRLAPGERSWGPGISAVYAESGEYVPGITGGGPGGESRFVPDGGWRPNARVEVKVSAGPFARSYRFSFTTGAGPSPDVTPSQMQPPGPKPTAPPADSAAGDRP